MKDKEPLYRQLVNDARQSYEERPKSQNSKGVILTWHESCEEINFWTYWQGVGNLDAEIMLVGQDWGHPDEGSRVIENIKKIKSGLPVGYLTGIELESVTDKNLKELFQATFDYDITERCRELFFTNLVLGYRSKWTSGNLRGSWIADDVPFFRRLADIIEPKVIICLGKDTFIGVVYALTGKRPRIVKYNAFLESDRNPILAELPSGKRTAVFAEAHCGAIGTMNRNRPRSKGEPWGVKLERQKEDWKKIKEYYDTVK